MTIKQFIKKLLGMDIDPARKNMDMLVEQGLTLGANPRIHSAYPFDALFPWLISVGDNVCISSNVKILAHDTSCEYVCGYTKIGVVDIGNNVYIGHGATILCNTRIGDHVIIGAGSVVSGDIPSDSVFAGVPAKYICSIEEFRQKHSQQLNTAPVFNGPWTRWSNASQEEKLQMREALKQGAGYMK